MKKLCLMLLGCGMLAGPVWADTTVAKEANANATVQNAGVRTGANNNNFFNIEGDTAGGATFDSYGVAQFPGFGLPAGSVLTVDSLTLKLTEANSGFTAPGSLNFWFTTNNAFSMTAGSNPPHFDPAVVPDGFLPSEIGPDIYFLGSGMFTSSGTSNTGQVDTYNFDLTSLDVPAQTYLIDTLNNSTTLRLIISPGDATVAATWAGFGHGTFDGPMLSFTYTSAFSDVSIGPGTTFSQSSFGGSAFSTTNYAVFDGAPGPVELSGAVAAGGLKFVVDGYSLTGTAGSTIATSSVQVDAGFTATISAQVTGTNALNKSGGGKLVLSGTLNDFAGNVGLNEGIIEVTADESLGNADNDLVFGGGVLSTPADISLGAGRALSGSGGIKIGAGSTLTVNGDINLNSLALSDSGTLALAGTSATIGGVTTTHASGTAAILGNYDLGVGDKTYNIANGSGDVDLLVPGNLTGANRIIKTGEGVLRLTGDNSGLGGLRIGIQSTTSPTNGGTVEAGSALALGTGQLQFNYGTLVALSDITGSMGLSIGGRASSPVTFVGANMEFQGDVGFFTTLGSSGPIVINVQNNLTFSGAVTEPGFPVEVENITISGTGRLTLGGGAPNTIARDFVLADSVTVVAAKSQALGSGRVTVQTNTKLEINADAFLPNTIVLAGGEAEKDFAVSELFSLILESDLAGGQDTSGALLDGSATAPVTATVEFTLEPTVLALNDEDRVSDVLSLSGLSGQIFALQMGVGWANSEMFLGWLDGGVWVNAVEGNSATGSLAMPGFVGSYESFTLSGGSPSADYLGSWGYDSETGKIWSILNHSSEFAVIPEPGAAAMLLLGICGLFAVRRLARR